MLEYRHGFEKIEELDFAKGNGLIPAIVQNAQDGQVLMLGYMNQEALEKTLQTRLVTFYSRDRQKLWTKGEESGNYLHLRAITTDCDRDTLLVLARPDGPTCHKGTKSCFDASPMADATVKYLAAQKGLL
ncbi:MAG TPA: phosphoribosyl-AMP cyclohydrolase [Candidatus Anaerobiospirillum stercoravium]|nr:phosphoribosyl-AMP cyclohydrolase [Candidatus Anaerobiospirillum stercoravium]